MVLVFAESPRGQFKKTALEAVTYGKKVAELLGDMEFLSILREVPKLTLKYLATNQSLYV